MPLKPLRDDLAIIPIEDPDMVGSLYVPEEAKQRTDQGIVKYKGPDVETIQVGDHVFFSGYSGRKISVEGEGILIFVEERFIEAIITDEESQVLLPTSEASRIIRECCGDLSAEGKLDYDTAQLVADEITSRFKSIVYAEGYEF